MSLETTYLIAGENFRPVNADDIGIKLDWRGDIAEAELNTDTIILSNRAKKLVLNHIDTFGVFEGVPIIIQVGNTALEYYIDLQSNPRISGFGDSEIEVSIKRRRSITWFREQVNALSFEVVNKTNPISTIDVPYLIIPDNQTEMLIMLLISSYTLTKALIEGIKQLVASITDFIKIVSVGLVVNTGQIISAALLLTANIIYVTALIVALIDLTKKIIELIFPKIRKLKGSTVRELVNKGCAKIGFTFSSTVLDELDKLTVMPVPLQKTNKSIFKNLISSNTQSYTKGYPTARDTTPTLGSLFNFLEDLTQSQIRIIGTTVYLEEDNYWQEQSGLQIINTLNLQDSRENQWTYNIDEAWKRYYLHWQYDSSDVHTMDKLDSLDMEWSTEYVTVSEPDLFVVKGLVDIGLPFAFGNRKESLTWVEKTTIPFAKLGDKVINFFGGSSSLMSKINGRIGVTQISQQYYTVSKMLWATNGKQPANYLTKIGALPIANRYHAKNKVKENFQRIETARIPLSTANFDTITNNNYVLDENGNSLKLLTFEFINESKEADIEYSVSSNEGNNTKTILIDG
jgi:hypothetical protein